jgi:hypothetical protein
LARATIPQLASWNRKLSLPIRRGCLTSPFSTKCVVCGFTLTISASNVVCFCVNRFLEEPLLCYRPRQPLSWPSPRFAPGWKQVPLSYRKRCANWKKQRQEDAHSCLSQNALRHQTGRNACPPLGRKADYATNGPNETQISSRHFAASGRVGLGAAELDLVQPAVETAASEQFFVPANIEDPPAVHGHNPIGHRQDGQPMRN